MGVLGSPMQKFLLSVVAMSIAVGAVAQSSQTVKMDGTVALMKMKPGYDGRIEDATIGAYEIARFPQIGWRAVRLPRAYRGQAGIDYYKSLSTVASVQFRYRSQIFMTPNDPMYSTQYAPQIMNAPRGWDITVGVSSQKLAVFDTGIDTDHPEFVGRLVDGYDFSDDDSDPNDDLPFNTYANHGVHVSGIAAASINNGTGIAGIAGGVSLMPIKVFPNSFDDVIAKALIYAADKGAKTVNMSLGRYGPPGEIMQDAVNYAWSKGCIVVAASGNDNVDVDANPTWPMNYDKVVGVGSTTSSDAKSDFSNYGQSVDVAAPGTAILSTFNVENGAYGLLDGTSMASPQVAGLIALLWSYAPAGTSNQEIVNAVKSTTTNVGNWVETGRVDIRRALDQIQPVQFATGSALATGYFPGTMNQPVAALQFTDGVTINPPTQWVQGLGQVAGIQTAFQQPAATIGKQIVGASMNYNVSTNYGGATFQVFIKNVSTGKWELSVQTPLKTGDRSIEFGFDPAKHTDGSGRIETIFRALLPIGPGNPSSGFTYKVDRSILRIRYRNIAP